MAEFDHLSGGTERIDTDSVPVGESEIGSRPQVEVQTWLDETAYCRT